MAKSKKTPPVSVVRRAKPKDAPLIVEFIRELAEFEGMRADANPDSEKLAKHIKGGKDVPRILVLIAEHKGKPVGCAVLYYNYSTFLTEWGFHLEDIFIREECRGTGAGNLLFERIGELVVGKYQRLDLKVLNWNEKAISLYTRLGFKPQTGWTPMRMEGESLQSLAFRLALKRKSRQPADAVTAANSKKKKC